VRIQFIDLPMPVPMATYQEAIERMTNDVLMRLPGIRAVYQIGSVSTPGISDVDMVALFSPGARCDVDPRADHSGTDRYLYTHHLYGAAVDQVPGILQHSAFHNYRYLAGEHLPALDAAASGADNDDQTLKTQVAIEFLVRMYVNMAQRLAYRIVKLRGFLLQVKAIRYDLEFLGIGDGRLARITDRFIAVRNEWFTRPLASSELGELVLEFQAALDEFLRALLLSTPFYLPGDRAYPLAPGQTLWPRAPLAWRRRGLRLPAAPGRISPRWINLQNRLNRFEFDVPARTSGLPPGLARRFELIGSWREYNRRCLPNFAILSSSLNV
jgi:hypothetical protein